MDVSVTTSYSFPLGENMKQLKLTAAATVLTLALSFSAFAGDIYGGIVDVPPQTATTTSSTTASSQSTAVDPVTQLMLVLLNLLP